MMYPWQQVIVAVEENEIPKLKNLYERGLTNKVKDLKLIGPEELKEIEPYCKVNIYHSLVLCMCTYL